MADEITKLQFVPTEILAQVGKGLEPCSIGVMILKGEVLVKGTVIGRISAGGSAGKYKAYSNIAADGTEVASGILKTAVDASTAGQNRDVDAGMYISGPFKEDALTGLDDAAKADLNGRSVPGRNLFIF